MAHSLVKNVAGKLMLGLAALGLSLVVWAVYDWVGRVINWLRFDVPIRSGQTVISFLAAHQVRWAVEPRSWVGLHESLEDMMLAAGAATVGVFLIGVAISIVSILDLDVGNGSDPTESPPK